MIIFLTRIPADTKRDDIIEFIEPILKGGLFKKSGYIRKINILILKDTVANKLEYHALVTVEPDKVAERVIKQLNRKPINGKHIAVREYVLRNWHNDPRVSMHQWNEEFKDRRNADRRRKNKLKVVNNIAVELTGRDGFNRTY